MRIGNGIRTGQVAGRAAQRSAADGGFHLEDGATAQRPAPASPSVPATGIEGLLALQAIEDPLLARRRAVRRGSALLDALAAAHVDVLTGEIGEGRLNQMMALVSQAREAVDPELARLIDDIELRVRVELAKRGRFAA